MLEAVQGPGRPACYRVRSGKGPQLVRGSAGTSTPSVLEAGWELVNSTLEADQKLVHIMLETRQELEP